MLVLVKSAYLIAPLYEFYGYSEPCLSVQGQLDEAKRASVQISKLHRILECCWCKFGALLQILYLNNQVDFDA